MIYILHFEHPHAHAGHYCGYTGDRLEARIAEHLTGDTPLLRAVLGAGNRFCVARTMEGDRTRERQIKNTHRIADYCPICCGRIPAPAPDSPDWYGASDTRRPGFARDTWRAARAAVRELHEKLAALPDDTDLLKRLGKAIARRRTWAQICTGA